MLDIKILNKSLFVTKLYKKGANIVGLMSITGHKKESTFLRYVKLTKLEK